MILFVYVRVLIVYAMHKKMQGQGDWKSQQFVLPANLLPPLQFIIHLTFFISNLTTRLIRKFIQNSTSFVAACFINKNSSRTP